MTKTYKVRKVVRGKAEADAIVCKGSFSFLGDVDMDTGEIIAQGNPDRGKTIAGKVLIYKETKGSSGGCVVLMTLSKKGKAPAAIVTVKPADYNLTEGAILLKIPFVCEPDGDILNEIKTGDGVMVDSDSGVLRRREEKD
jgi:predicted aconitase with swiveling domain